MNAIADRLDFFYDGKIPISIDPDGSVHLEAPIREIATLWEQVWAENKYDIAKRVFTGMKGRR